MIIRPEPACRPETVQGQVSATIIARTAAIIKGSREIAAQRSGWRQCCSPIRLHETRHCPGESSCEEAGGSPQQGEPHRGEEAGFRIRSRPTVNGYGTQAFPVLSSPCRSMLGTSALRVRQDSRHEVRGGRLEADTSPHSFVDMTIPSVESIENSIIIPSRPAAPCACDNSEYIPSRT